jgi:signal transduction histidine kinase
MAGAVRLRNIIFCAVTIFYVIAANGQSPDFLQKRVDWYEQKFGKGNVFTQQIDIQRALLLKDTLLQGGLYHLVAEQYKTIGKMYQYIGHMGSAERSFLEAVRFGQLGKDSVWVAKTCSRLGGFYTTENRNFLALEWQQKALSLLEKYDTTRKAIPEVYNDISKAYIQLGELETAEQYLEKSLALKKELKDTFKLGIISTLYADIYRLKGDYAKAESFYIKDIPKRKKQKNYEGLVISYLGLGDTYMEWKKYDEAEKTYLLALQAADTIKRYRTIGLSLVKLGQLYMATGRDQDASAVFNRAIKECTQVDSRDYQLTAYLSMYKLYKKRNDVGEALRFLEKYTEVNQLHTAESMTLKSEDLTAAIELKERENELRRMDIENRKNAQTRQVLTMGIVLLLLLSGFLIYLFFTRNKILASLEKEQAQTKMLLAEKEELLKNLEESHHHLVHTEKMASIGVMTAGIAHELNNPVSSMHACAEALTMDYEELLPLFTALVGMKKSETTDFVKIEEIIQNTDLENIMLECKTLLNTMTNGSQRTSDIILGLKTFVRDGGDIKQSYKPEEGLDAALTLLHHKMKDKINVDKHYAFGQLITCNVSKINQVFLNILDNAVQAMPQTGKIRIQTSMEGQYCCIKISDNGPGMDETTQKKIFEPFFTTKEVGKGTGLGLAISYAIIKEHQGDILVESATGEGTTFTILLPL